MAPEPAEMSTIDKQYKLQVPTDRAMATTLPSLSTFIASLMIVACLIQIVQKYYTRLISMINRMLSVVLRKYNFNIYDYVTEINQLFEDHSITICS